MKLNIFLAIGCQKVSELDNEYKLRTDTRGKNGESVEYAKLLDKRMKEAEEKRQEQISKIRKFTKSFCFSVQSILSL